MSRRLFTTQLWVSLVAVMLLAGVFLGGVYFWLNSVQQYILETETPEADQPEQEEATDIAENTVESQEATLAALQAERALGQLEMDMEFPCMIQIVDGEIGVFQPEGRCVKKLSQVGEYLSAADEQVLRRGIQVNNEEELVMVLESYHLQ